MQCGNSPAWPQPGYIYIYIHLFTRPFSGYTTLSFELKTFHQIQWVYRTYSKYFISYSKYIGLTRNIPLTRFCPTILTQSLPLTLFWHQIVIPSPVRLVVAACGASAISEKWCTRFFEHVYCQFSHILSIWVPTWFLIQEVGNLIKWLCQLDAHRNSVQKDVLFRRRCSVKVWFLE